MRIQPALVVILAALVLFGAACGASGEDAAVAGSPLAADPTVRADDGSAEAATAPTASAEAAASSSSDEGGGSPAIRELPAAAGIPTIAPSGPQPTGIRILDLGIDGNAVRPVGVEENGEYEVPIASEVGWYRYGSAPGEPGSSVLAGHIAYDGENGVFANLVDAELGSIVEITLDDGTALAYEIVELSTYDKTALPFEEIFSESGPDRIVLITCGGNFNPGLQSYESNVVAYASPVGLAGG